MVLSNNKKLPTSNQKNLVFRRQLKTNKRRRKDRQMIEYHQSADKDVEQEGGGDTNYSWYFWNNPQQLGTISRVYERTPVELKIRRRIKTIQTTALLRTDSILRRVLET